MIFRVYYYDYRCDERLKTKNEESQVVGFFFLERGSWKGLKTSKIWQSTSTEIWLSTFTSGTRAHLHVLAYHNLSWESVSEKKACVYRG
jgi:hypothetical protein